MKIWHLTLFALMAALSFSFSTHAQELAIPLDSIQIPQDPFYHLYQSDNQAFYSPLVGAYRVRPNGISSEKGHYFIGIQEPDMRKVIPMPGAIESAQPKEKFYSNPPKIDYKKLPQLLLPALPFNHR